MVRPAQGAAARGVLQLGSGSNGMGAEVEAVVEGAMPPTAQIMLMGERHSSTSFVEALLRHNFADGTCAAAGETETCAVCQCQPPSTPFSTMGTAVSGSAAAMTCCWKHGYANHECDRCHNPSSPVPARVFLLRSPYSWIVAMHSNGYGLHVRGTSGAWQRLGRPPRGKPAALSFSQLLKKPVKECAPPDWTRCIDEHPDIVALWNAKAASYLAYTQGSPPSPSTSPRPRMPPAVRISVPMIYNLSSLRRAFAPLLAHDAGRYRIRLRPGLAALEYPPFAPDTSTNDNHEGVFTRKAFETARRYELGDGWHAAYTTGDIEWITSRLNMSLLEAFGLAVPTITASRRPSVAA